MTILRISIFGISCLADPRTGDAFKKRVLLPTDTIWDPQHPPHIPYVEVAEDDFYSNPSTIPGLSDPYERNDVVYRRFELYGHRLWIDDIVTSQGWWVSPLFDLRVPKMRKVLPYLYDHPNAVCFDRNPPTSLISGYFDISYGRLSIGEIDDPYTIFYPPKEWPDRRLAVSSVLELEVDNVLPEFRIEEASLPPGTGPVRVRLKPEAVGISIGNLPVSDLAPQQGVPSTDDPSHDFMMFYKLADPEPPNPPLPTRQTGLEVSCTNTNWP